MADIEMKRLSCGATLVCERMSGVRSAGLTWLVPAGSARDPESRIGLSAMHAELLLRGAGSLDSRTQADAFDALGVSRSTRVETFSTSLGATMLGSRVNEALELLVPMVLDPTMGADSVEPVRALCVSSIEALADEPQDRVMVNLRAAHAPSPVNRSSRGTLEGVKAIRAEEALPEWKSRATPEGSIIALAGDIDVGAVERRLNELLEGWNGKAAHVAVKGSGPRGYHHEDESTDQIHIAVAYDGPREIDEDASWLERMATAVLSGGMSGRLFTEVREKRSLCYSVWASYGAEREYGRTVGYAGTTPERAQETLDVMMNELRRIGRGDGAVTEEELERARVGMKSRLVFSGESSAARATALAHDFRKLGRARSLDEMAARIDAVELGALNAYLSTRELGVVSLATIGPKELRFSD